VYSTIGHKESLLFLNVKYYTTFRSIESIKNEKNKKEMEDKKEEDKKEDNNKENNDKKDKEVLFDLDDKMGYKASYIINDENSEFPAEKLEEKMLLKTIFSSLRRKSNGKFTVTNNLLKLNKPTKLSLIRYIFLNNTDKNIILNCNIINHLPLIENNNTYVPNYINSFAKPNSLVDILYAYRKSEILEFIKGKNSIEVNLNVQVYEQQTSDQYFSSSDVD
jgi:hypothetical protein